MPQAVFTRADLRITIRPSPEGGVELTFAAGSEAAEGSVVLSPSFLLRLFSGASDTSDTSDSADVPHGLLQHAARAYLAAAEKPIDAHLLLFRLTLEVDDPELAALPWHPLLAELFATISQAIATGPQGALSWRPPLMGPVHVSPVFPSVLTTDFTLPLRILQILGSAPPDWRATAEVPLIFGHHPWDKALKVNECPFEKLEDFRHSENWPTAEILHFDNYPFKHENLWASSEPGNPGTLGWLSRLTDIWQTRLVVLLCATGEQAQRARRLAGLLLRSGGPAVLLCPAGPQAAEFLSRFYGQLVHDFPLDWALRDAQSASGIPAELFAGAGREESLRVSEVGANIDRLTSHVQKDLAAVAASEKEWAALLTESTRGYSFFLKTPAKLRLTEETIRLQSIKKRQEETGESQQGIGRFLEKVSPPLASFKQAWDTEWTYSLHESAGLLPMADQLETVRAAAGISGPASPANRPLQGERYTNSAFYQQDPNFKLQRLDSRDSILEVGSTYHLGVDLGRQEEDSATLDALPMLEEVFKWQDGKEGVWVEVGITGLDFETIGEPVQELWLPRDHASARLYFAVVPRVAGVSRLRFCVYYQNNLLQSWRVAALTAASDNPAKLLAEALEVKPERAKDRTWLARLEYAAEAAGTEPARPRRALSLVANQLDGKPVITFKGSDVFNITTNDDLYLFVEKARAVLNRISARNPDKPSKEWLYAFAGKKEDNEKFLKAGLRALAEQGWRLYDTIMPAEKAPRKALSQLLEAEGQTIHVAHMLLEKVIPWAILYQHRYDPRAQPSNGRPVAWDACLAPLKDCAGCPAITRCGEHPDCLLHPNQIQQRAQRGEPELRPETVACPRHFWGFRHIIEVPPLQAVDGAATAAVASVLAGAKVKALGAYHGSLGYAPHRDTLKALVPGAEWQDWYGDRQALLNVGLEQEDLDLIYFFCHSESDGPSQQLRLRPDPGTEGFLDPEDLSPAADWTHRPLVILNGCGTVGSSPRAPSRFIRKFVSTCGASGVLGTEAPVFEPVATRMGTHFLKAFLAGKNAGEALLLARRALLAEGNPLGLNYTLYALADLALAKPVENDSRPNK